MLAKNKTKLLKTLEINLGENDFSYYQNLKRIERLANTLTAHTSPEDRLLNLGSGAFLLECILEDQGYTHLTAVDIDNRLLPLYERLICTGLLNQTTFHKQEISSYSSTHLYKFITLYDCVYYPNNNIIDMLPQLQELLKDGGLLFFDVYDESVYKRIKPFYNLVRKKYRDRCMYNLVTLNDALSVNGFEIEEVKIELGTKNILIKVLLKVAFVLTGRALVVNYLARKRRTS